MRKHEECNESQQGTMKEKFRQPTVMMIIDNDLQ